MELGELWLTGFHPSSDFPEPRDWSLSQWLQLIVLTEPGIEADPAHPTFLLPAKTSCP